ncbi:serine/arginine repetitive matrix protein 2-like isoform X2 [Manacus candei]|uniref:serine/arginine repetitive matrix protein 2-like isoform X2 n=1 Tax=Manacus candei TaxID=415023 RepID=UPI0022271A26|nr:serine/arginine repetitive matrix protein 2-like isoform X2 [Manacus candei]
MGLLCSFQNCYICGQIGATIYCCGRHCELSFHLPCAKQGRCVTQFITPYRDRLCMLVISPSSAPSAEIVTHFARICSPWGSESPTATRDESGLAGVSVARQPGLEPCDGSREPATISPNTGNLVLSGLSPSSAPLETVSPSTSTQVPAPASSAPQTSKRRTNRQATSEQPLQSPSQGTGSSSPDSQITSGSSQSSFTETEDSSCSSSRGPDRRQNHPRRQRRAQTAHFRSRSPLDRTHVTAPSPGRRRTRQRPSGTSRRRNRSRLQRQTPDPSGRSRSPLDRNCTPAPSAGRRNSRETAARTSQRQQHCRRQRRTSNSSNRSRSPHDRSRVRAPSTARRTHRWDGETGTHR